MNLIKRLVRLIKSSALFLIKKELAAFKYIFKAGMYTSVAAFLMIGTCFLIESLIRWLHPLPPLPDLFNPFSGFDSITLISVCLSIGLIEEGMFRYLFYDCIFRKWLGAPIWIAALLSAVLFGAAHFNNAIMANISLWYVVPQVIGASVLGFFFVYLYNRVGLHMAILVHAAYDYLVMGASNNKILSDSIYYVFAAGAVIISLWLVRKAWNKIYG